MTTITGNSSSSLSNLAVQNTAAAVQPVKITATNTSSPTISTKNSSTVSISPPAVAKLATTATLVPMTVAQVLAPNATIPANTVIKDTTANIKANLSALAGLSGISNVSSITLSDTKAGTISVARSDLTGDLSDANNVTPSLVVLRKITSSYTLNVTGMTVSDALTLKTPAKATTLTVGISDTLDNVMSNLTSLQAAAKVKAISGITLPSTTAGSAKPVLSITAAQLKANPDVLATIKGDYDLTITGVAAADALTTAGNADKVLKASGALSAQATIAISDTSANLVKNIATLETLATAGRLTSITVSDGKALSLTETQIKADSHFLATQFTSATNIEATNVTAADVLTVQSIVNGNNALTLTKESISDTALNIQANLDSLEISIKNSTIPSASNTFTISSIGVTDKGSITLYNSTLVNDIDALKVLTGKYTLNVTDINVADALALKTPSKDATLALSVKDTAANISGNWDKLQTLAKGKTLSAINVTDSTSSLLAMTSAQLKADADALKLVGGDYKLSVTGVAAADVTKVLTTKNIYSVEVKDTAANILKNLASIQTAVTAAKIQNVVITDASNPSLSIDNIFALTTTLPNVTLAAGVKFNIKDTASNIIAHARYDNGDVLKNAGTIILSDKTTPTLTLADAITLKGITNLDKAAKYNIADGGSTIANQAAIADETVLSGASKVVTAHVLSVAQYAALAKSKNFDPKTVYIIQDTTQNVITQANTAGDKILSGASSVVIQDTAGSITGNLSALQSLANNQKLTNINLIDSGTPSLNLTTSQIASSLPLLGKIVSSFNPGNGVGFQPSNAATSLTPWSAPAAVTIAPNSYNFRTYERPINNGSILANVSMDTSQLNVDGPRSAALYLTPQDGLGNSGASVKVADIKTTLPNGYGPQNGGIFTINFASSGNGTAASKNMQAIVWMDLQSDGTYTLKGRTYTVSTTGIANDPNSASVVFNGDAQTLVSGISSKLANFNWTNINVANNTNMCFEYETLDDVDTSKKNAYEASFSISSDFKTFNQLSTASFTSGANAGAILIAPLMDAKATTGEISNGNNGQATFVYEATQNGQTGLVFNDLSSQSGLIQNTRFLPLGSAADNIKLNTINNIPLTDPSVSSTYWMNQMIGITGSSTDPVTGDKNNFAKFIKLNSWLPANSTDPNMTPLAVTTINLPNKAGGMWNCNTNYNTSMWAFQEGNTAHAVQVDGNGKVISDDKITLPPGSVLDRIRNTNDTNTSMFELLWREPDIANPGANIIKYQIFDIRNNAPQYVIDNTSNTLSYLAGAAGNDTMQGRGAGVNIFSGGAGNDTIAGGTSGQDIVSYTGKSTDYSIKLDPNDVTKIIVSDLRVGSPDGTDTLSGISKLRFSDTVIDCASIK